MKMSRRRLGFIVVTAALVGHVALAFGQTTEQTGIGAAIDKLDFKSIENALDEQWQGPVGDAIKYGAGAYGTGLAIYLGTEVFRQFNLSGRINAEVKRTSPGVADDFDDDSTTATATSTATATQ